MGWSTFVLVYLVFLRFTSGPGDVPSVHSGLRYGEWFLFGLGSGNWLGSERFLVDLYPRERNESACMG